MSYLSVRDRFATFVADALAARTTPIPFHWYLFDGDDPTQDRLKLNTINLSYLGDDSADTLDITTVSIDIIHTKERTAIEWQDYITNSILRKPGMIKNQDMVTDVDNAIDLYGFISWDIRDIRWVNVDNPNYCHLNSTFDLYHVIPPDVI